MAEYGDFRKKVESGEEKLNVRLDSIGYSSKNRRSVVGSLKGQDIKLLEQDIFTVYKGAADEDKLEIFRQMKSNRRDAAKHFQAGLRSKRFLNIW
jgi:hypothetical protein